MKHVLVFFLIWLVLAAIGGVLGFWAFYSPEMERLAMDGIQIYGTVTARDRENHRTIDYFYIVNGERYTGFGGTNRGNPDFDRIETGQQIIITYDPRSPERSVPGYAKEYTGFQNTGMFFGIVAFPIFPMAPIFIIYSAILYSRRKNKLQLSKDEFGH